ncbi:MAG: tRNA (uracil-5-)-methyltransferase [Gammaproteobacteria bacterium]|nr:tRNA (uracil-5-)-methyltransferase [Gammaproteobacteria bacterium]
MTPESSNNNVFSLDGAREAKEHDRKEEKLAKMAQRFEQALPTKATPVKDYLKKKRKAKNKKKR